MSRKLIYCIHSHWIFALFALILVTILGLLFVGAVGLAFRQIGFSPHITIMILVATFAGSYINIPLFKLRTIIPIVKEDHISFFGIAFKIPQIDYEEFTTLVAMNLGGAVIPTIVSIYLILRFPQIMPYALAGTLLVATLTHLVAKPVRGLGIVTPAFIPPLAAALAAYVLPSGAPAVVAYVSGVLGTLVGADLLNMHQIPKLGAKIASIGGAGTFDGVFLSGIIAVLLI